jgi:hypothetical protein
MRAAIFITTTVLCLAFCGWEARAQNDAVWFWGIGQHSCANWLSNGPAAENAGENWIWGFWSGLNVFSNTNRVVGHGVDAAGIMGEIKKVCIDHPSANVFQAVRQVYDMIAAEHR